jgi:hypothetical protein
MINPLTASRLGPVRDAMLDLHRVLLDTERAAWQRMNGRVVNNAEMLQLAINDPWFAWLQPMTALLVALDDAIMDRSEEAVAEVPRLLATARTMLHPDDSGTEFQQRYFEFVQRSPDVAVAHGHVMTALGSALGERPGQP